MNGGVQDLGPFGVRMSSFCSDRGCVGVVIAGDEVSVVDTKSFETGLRFTRDEWIAFVAGVKNGEFDLDRPA